MPFLDLPTHRLHYRIDGPVHASAAPWLLFCNSLGTDLSMWDGQMAALSPRFRILRYDRRGHGESTAPPPPYSLADLGGDVLALLDHLKIERAHFCGLSIGGLTGQWLGVHAGQRFEKIAVCATAAKIGTQESWRARIEEVRTHGLGSLTAATVERWFTPQFQAERPNLVKRIMEGFVRVSPEAYAGCCMALAGADLRGDLGRIANPLLAVSGAEDPVCSPCDLQAIADAVQRGRHISIPGRHIVNIESVTLFDEILLSFLVADQ